jgi:hypothetical protein
MRWNGQKGNQNIKLMDALTWTLDKELELEFWKKIGPIPVFFPLGTDPWFKFWFYIQVERTPGSCPVPYLTLHLASSRTQTKFQLGSSELEPKLPVPSQPSGNPTNTGKDLGHGLYQNQDGYHMKKKKKGGRGAAGPGPASISW